MAKIEIIDISQADHYGMIKYMNQIKEMLESEKWKILRCDVLPGYAGAHASTNGRMFYFMEEIPENKSE